MVNTLIAALVMAVIIGVVFWAVESILDVIPLDGMFRRIVHIIIVLITLIVAYNQVIVPVLGVMDIRVPRIMG